LKRDARKERDYDVVNVPCSFVWKGNREEKRRSKSFSSAALKEKASELLVQPPSIEKVDGLAASLPAKSLERAMGFETMGGLIWEVRYEVSTCDCGEAGSTSR
jgi:hypothetical protein